MAVSDAATSVVVVTFELPFAKLGTGRQSGMAGLFPPSIRKPSVGARAGRLVPFATAVLPNLVTLLGLAPG